MPALRPIPARFVPPRLLLAWLLLAIVLSACSSVPRLAAVPPDGVILAFGDSLTWGTGAERDQAYPARLAALIERRVINAGIPGETTAEGAARLPGVLAEYRPRLVLLCLGGNDMLRKLPPAQTAANLRLMLTTLRTSGIEVVLIGVPKPQFFGGAADFYDDLAEEFRIPYEGAILNEVLKNISYKSDPIHPNADGYARIAERLADLLRSAGAVPAD